MYCTGYVNTPRDKCWDMCERLFKWYSRYCANREEVLSRGAAKTTQERVLDAVEQEVNKQTEELISALDQSGVLPEKEGYTDEELEAFADEILKDLEKEGQKE